MELYFGIMLIQHGKAPLPIARCETLSQAKQVAAQIEALAPGLTLATIGSDSMSPQLRERCERFRYTSVPRKVVSHA